MRAVHKLYNANSNSRSSQLQSRSQNTSSSPSKAPTATTAITHLRSSTNAAFPRNSRSASTTLKIFQVAGSSTAMRTPHLRRQASAFFSRVAKCGHGPRGPRTTPSPAPTATGAYKSNSSSRRARRPKLLAASLHQMYISYFGSRPDSFQLNVH
jgi:hypothetical protein